MQGVFYWATGFNQPLNGWNVSRVTSMFEMFWEATKFDQPLNQWEVGQVTDMYAMFYSAYRFNQDLCQWGNFSTFPFGSTGRMFDLSGYIFKASPTQDKKGPFCASDCLPSSSSSSSSFTTFAPIATVEYSELAGVAKSTDMATRALQSTTRNVGTKVNIAVGNLKFQNISYKNLYLVNVPKIHNHHFILLEFTPKAWEALLL